MRRHISPCSPLLGTAWLLMQVLWGHAHPLTSLLTCPITKFWGFRTCSQSSPYLEQPQGLSSINSASLTTGSSQKVGTNTAS